MNRLDGKVIKEVAEKRFVKKRVGIELDGETYFVKVATKFKDSEIDEMIQKIAEDMESAEKAGLETNSMILSNLAILDIFTDLEFPDDVVDKVAMFVNLVDLGIMEEIFKHFDESEFDKIGNHIEKLRTNLPKAIELIKQQSEINNDITGKVEEAVKGN